MGEGAVPMRTDGRAPASLAVHRRTLFKVSKVPNDGPDDDCGSGDGVAEGGDGRLKRQLESNRGEMSAPPKQRQCDRLDNL